MSWALYSCVFVGRGGWTGSYVLTPNHYHREIIITAEIYNSNTLDFASNHARKLKEDTSSNYCY